MNKMLQFFQPKCKPETINMFFFDGSNSGGGCLSLIVSLDVPFFLVVAIFCWRPITWGHVGICLVHDTGTYKTIAIREANSLILKIRRFPRYILARGWILSLPSHKEPHFASTTITATCRNIQ